MTKRSEYGLSINEHADKGLAYVENFKRLVHENPKILQRSLELMDLAEGHGIGQRVSSNDLSVTFWGDDIIRVGYTQEDLPFQTVDSNEEWTAEENRKKFTYFFQLDYKESSYFIKRTPIDLEYDGFSEAMASAEATENLKDVKGVQVNKFYLGFKDKRFGYFVSEWKNLPKLGKYLGQLNRQRREIVEAKLTERLETTKRALRGEGWVTSEINDNNSFYDESSDTIFLYDLNKHKNITK